MLPKLIFSGVIIFLTLTSSNSYAEQKPSSHFITNAGTSVNLFDIQEINVRIENQVKNSCMPDSSSVKAAFEAALGRNGINATEDERNPLAPHLYITAIGYEDVSGYCTVHLSFNLIKIELIHTPYAEELGDSYKAFFSPWTWNVLDSMISKPKSEIQQAIQIKAEEAADKLFINIYQSRANVKDRWPELWNSYMLILNHK